MHDSFIDMLRCGNSLDVKDNDASPVFGTLLFLLDSFIEPIIPYDSFETLLQAISVRNIEQIRQVCFEGNRFSDLAYNVTTYLKCL